MAAPNFVSEYPTAFNTTASPKIALNAISIQSGDVLVGVGIAEGYSVENISINEDGASSFSSVQSGGPVIDSAHYSLTQSWVYVAPSNETITVSASRSSENFGVNIIRVNQSSGIGSSSINHGTGLPSVSITTTQANSAILVAVSDYWALTYEKYFSNDGGAGSATRLTGWPGDAAIYGFEIGYYPDAGAIGEKIVGMTGPNQQFIIIAIEIKGIEVSLPSIPVLMSQYRRRSM